MLMDILISVAIISIALVGISLAFRQSTVTTVSARNSNQATLYAQQALEQLKVYDGQTSGTWNPAWPVIPASGTMPQYTVTTGVLATGEAPDYDALGAAIRAKLVPVRATVDWQEAGSSGILNQSVTVIRYYYLK